MRTGGTTRTITQLLLKDGFSIANVRMFVLVGGSSSASGTAVRIVGGEGEQVTPLAGGDSFDLADIVKKVGAGSAFGARIDKRGTPFTDVRPDESTSGDGYHKFLDAVMFLP